MASATQPIAGSRSGAGAGIALPLATGILGLYVFLLVSRLVEFLGLLGLEDIYLMMLFSVLTVLLAVVTGQIFRALWTWPGRFLLAFTGWMLLATTTSQWHIGSLMVLKEAWLRSVISFLAVASLITTRGQMRKTLLAVAAGMGVAAVLTGWFGGLSSGRLSFQFGTLSNANMLAFYLLFGSSFVLLAMSEGGWIVKVAAGAIVLLLFGETMLTGSRGGLIIMGVVVLVALMVVSVAKKLVMLALVPTLALIAWSVVPQSVLSRYVTIFGAPAVMVDASAAESAVISEQARFVHLMDSLDLTVQNPVLGVGPGVFQAAAADYERSQGRRTLWRETHNAYTQVSSECGIPGLILFLAFLGSIWKTLSRVRRSSRTAGDRQRAMWAGYLMLAMLVVLLDGFFDSIAYMWYMPFLAGLAVALDRVGLETAAPAAERGAVFPAPLPAHVSAGLRQQAPEAPVGARLGFGGYRRLRP